ncbi:MAG TPA: tRNA dihydrouridine synthase DusB [Anaerolineales bacterium]|nr:tRNA dihydrouridine synthase DusB [Anaerolineales bacterium]
MKTAVPTFNVDSIPIYGDTILSPMDGFSDLPFRGLARHLGSAMSYTEFVSARGVMDNLPKVEKQLAFEEDERPVVFQLFDDDPDIILAAARKLLPRRPDIFDINMGCSAPSVSSRGAGAGLLRTPEKVAEIMTTLSAEFDLPITAKIRLGWDEETLNYLEIARIVEECGGKLIAVHGRTKSQGYGGRANWESIAEIKSVVSIPVIGNGDVKTPQDKEEMMAQTGCDAVMIGRAAIGNPWIFSDLRREQVSDAQVREMVEVHLSRMQEFYGKELGLLLFRKHAKQYISPYPLKKAARTKLLLAETKEAFLSLLDQITKLSPQGENA